MKWNRSIVSLVVGMAFIGAFAAVSLAEKAEDKLPAPAQREVKYTVDIKPILSARCYDCHANGKRKGGFSMDTREQFLKEAVAGKSAESKVVKVVVGVGVDEDEVMPPKGDRLTAEQIGLLRAWIDQGVKWE